MSRYIIYTYQFSPITSVQGSLFHNNMLPVKERMEKKQEIFESYFLQNSNKPYQGRTEYHDSKILYHRDHFIVFQLANNTYQQIEEKFHVNKYPHHPSCIVIIDNRHDIQHIAIEDNSTAFSDTNVVAHILSITYAHFLKKYGLQIEIKRDFQESEFWSLVDRYPSITMVRFNFSYPNLPRTLSSINKMIAENSALTNSKNTTFEFKSDPSEQLVLKKKNRKLSALTKASADSGHTITIKAKGIKHHIHTGTTFKTIEIDNLKIILNDANLLESPTEKLASIFNKIK